VSTISFNFNIEVNIIYIFYSTEDDEDSMPKFRATTVQRSYSDDSDSISDISMDSRATFSPAPSKPKPPAPLVPPPPRPNAAPVPAPPAKVEAPIPPPSEGGGFNLLSAANPALNNMLTKAKNKAGSDSDSEGSGDWD
jgi:hypothetical protein